MNRTGTEGWMGGGKLLFEYDCSCSTGYETLLRELYHCLPVCKGEESKVGGISVFIKSGQEVEGR